jgi:3-hydroxyisobutyrate dehydrogenase-like beta-hydroxyacid dehydrogenase
MSPVTKVGVVGLGAIGFGMAESLIRANFSVTAFDISADAVSRLRRAGGHAADSPSELAASSECLICIVATSDQTKRLFFDSDKKVLRQMPQRSTIILGITARPDFVSTFQEHVREAGRPDISVIDCPVSGGEARARAGSLSLLCSGDNKAIAQMRPVLGAIGSEIHEIPGGLGAASRIKFAHQILVAVNIAAAVEMAALARAARLDLAAVHKQVMSSNGASWLFGQRVGHIVDAKSVPASSLSIILKDIVSPTISMTRASTDRASQ